MHTGQPGPMITSSAGGNAARRPNFAIACSWLPQTCITDTRPRPTRSVARASASRSAAARAGSRNSRGIDLSADVGGHQVRVRLLQQLLVQRERRLDVAGRDAADREADVVEHVVADGDRLVGQIEPHAPANAPEV